MAYLGVLMVSNEKWWDVVPVGAQLIQKALIDGTATFQHDHNIYLVDLFNDEVVCGDTENWPQLPSYDDDIDEEWACTTCGKPYDETPADVGLCPSCFAASEAEQPVQCIDCGQAVHLNPGGFWPYRAADGTDVCTAQTSPWGHRVWQWETDRVK
jgi:hypothetical protein